MKQVWMIISLSVYVVIASAASEDVHISDDDSALCHSEFNECRRVASLNYSHCNFTRRSGCRETLFKDMQVCNENFQKCWEKETFYEEPYLDKSPDHCVANTSIQNNGFATTEENPTIDAAYYPVPV